MPPFPLVAVLLERCGLGLDFLLAFGPMSPHVESRQPGDGKSQAVLIDALCEHSTLVAGVASPGAGLFLLAFPADAAACQLTQKANNQL